MLDTRAARFFGRCDTQETHTAHSTFSFRVRRQLRLHSVFFACCVSARAGFVARNQVSSPNKTTTLCLKSRAMRVFRYAKKKQPERRMSTAKAKNKQSTHMKHVCSTSVSALQNLSAGALAVFARDKISTSTAQLVRKRARSCYLRKQCICVV